MSSELTDLTAVTTLGGDEVMYVVDNPSTTPVDRKVTVTNLLAGKQDASADLTDLVARSSPATTSTGAAMAFPEATTNGTHKVNLLTPTALAADTLLALPSTTGTIATTADIDALPELTAATPTEVNLTTVGTTTTLTLTALIARQVDVAVNTALHNARLDKIVGEYYSTSYAIAGTSEAGTQDRITYIPMILAAGTIDTLVIDLAVVQASCTARLGIYGTTGGVPGTLISEFTSGTPIDLSTGVGNKTATGTAVIPTSGLYWITYVVQGAAPAALRVRQGQALTCGINVPLGTGVPAASTLMNGCRRGVASGAMPGTAALNTTDSAGQYPWRIYYKYSA